MSFYLRLSDGYGRKWGTQDGISGHPRRTPGAGGRAERPRGAVPAISPSLGITLAPALQGIPPPVLPITAQKSSQEGSRATSDPGVKIWASGGVALGKWRASSSCETGLLLPASPHQKPRGYEKVLAGGDCVEGLVTGLTSREGCDAL